RHAAAIAVSRLPAAPDPTCLARPSLTQMAASPHAAAATRSSKEASHESAEKREGEAHRPEPERLRARQETASERSARWRASGTAGPTHQARRIDGARVRGRRVSVPDASREGERT